jgi:8-oxo-dGTP pyrophosphatase MutT (NUDIX family)
MASDKIKDFSKRLSGAGEGSQELVPAATVVLLRPAADGFETLMLRKNSKLAFGGMWVFPGGRIDPEDGHADLPMEDRARIAAVREAMEEAQLELRAEELQWFSHWTPPALGNRRFATWFFVTAAPRADVVIDDGEITESQWMTPAAALASHQRGEIELVPPTYVSLHYLAQYSDPAAALAALGAAEPRYYATHIGQEGDDLVAMWEGDAGYESGDATVPGPRHRLRMGSDGFQFDDSGITP